MPTIIETIIDYEPDLLEMIAEGWGIDQDLDPSRSLPKQIAQRLQEEALFNEILQALPKPAFNALARLVRNDGRLRLEVFEREFGSLREMGAARREKLRPDRNPDSISETLFYKGLIAQAFFRDGPEAQEFIYIPEEFLQILIKEVDRVGINPDPDLAGHTPDRTFQCDDFILDHACTLLAAVRAGLDTNSLGFENPEIPITFLTQLLAAAGLLLDEHKPDPQKIGAFLEAPRADSFSQLVRIWRSSPLIDEIHLLTALEIEGSLKSNPARIREKLLAMLQPLSADKWFSIEEFILWVKANQPDFMRSGGEYDTWIIRDKKSGQYIKGFEFWDKVEGAFLQLILTGPFFWMGLVDLGVKARSRKPAFFRLSRWAASLLAGKPVEYQKAKTDAFILNKNGRLCLERSFPLGARYQIARFCEWQKPEKGKYYYQISPAGLQNALRQGLQVSQFSGLIAKYAKKPIPPALLPALERWNQNKLEAVIERPVLLRVQSAAILDELLTSRAKAHILTRLNDTTAIVKTSSAAQLKEALLEMGILAEIRLDV